MNFRVSAFGDCRVHAIKKHLPEAFGKAQANGFACLYAPLALPHAIGRPDGGLAQGTYPRIEWLAAGLRARAGGVHSRL